MEIIDSKILIDKLFKNQLNSLELDAFLRGIKDKKKEEEYTRILEKYFELYFKKENQKLNG